MSEPGNQSEPNYVVCHCQHCDGHIEFDANEFAEANSILPCPHCGLETKIAIPIVAPKIQEPSASAILAASVSQTVAYPLESDNSPRYVTCYCEHCAGEIRFDANSLIIIGKQIPCPHCGLQTGIFAPQPSGSQRDEVEPVHTIEARPLPLSTIPQSEMQCGLPIYEAEICGKRLARRDILVTNNGQQQKLTIDILRTQFYAGLIPAEAHVLVTSFYCQQTYYCGEGNVGSVVAAWESAPLEDFDLQDAKRMIQEFGLPEYDLLSKAKYYDLKRLYDRCNVYYRHISDHDKKFKRLTKSATKDLVFLLDKTQPGWDATDGKNRFAEEVRRHHPELVRSEDEKKAKKKREQDQAFRHEERLPLIEARNNLTNFPHKDMEIEIQNLGAISIRAIKPKIREGVITPETLVRYRSDSDWLELCEFLNDWMRNKATDRQISYLKSLQKQHGITTEIPLDISRQDISDRITQLAPPEREHICALGGNSPAEITPVVADAQMNADHFIIVELQQGTTEWREWRHNGIGASDASTIMGENRFKSAAQLLNEKLGPAQDYGQNAAMARGAELEPEARRLYIAKTGREVRPVCLQSTRYDWLRASLDGFAINHDAVVEIKCGQSAYRTASQTGSVPDYYYGQMQHILAVTGLD
jgi:putative phage-type endonuclease